MASLMFIFGLGVFNAILFVVNLVSYIQTGDYGIVPLINFIAIIICIGSYNKETKRLTKKS